MREVVYYAHSKKIYNTSREKMERSYIEKRFKAVCCPNRDMGELGSMNPYIDKVKGCHAVVCTEFQGHIGKGVYEEITAALRFEKEVYCLRRRVGVFQLHRIKEVMIVDDTDWGTRYGKVKVAR